MRNIAIFAKTDNHLEPMSYPLSARHKFFRCIPLKGLPYVSTHSSMHFTLNKKREWLLGHSLWQTHEHAEQSLPKKTMCWFFVSDWHQSCLHSMHCILQALELRGTFILHYLSQLHTLECIYPQPTETKDLAKLPLRVHYASIFIKTWAELLHFLE